MPAVTEWKTRVRIGLVKKVGETLAKEAKARRTLAAVRGAAAEGAAEFQNRVNTVLMTKYHEGLCVECIDISSDADAGGLLRAWEAHTPPVLVINGDADAYVQAKTIAGQLVDDLLEFLCMLRLGHSYAAVAQETKVAIVRFCKSVSRLAVKYVPKC